MPLRSGDTQMRPGFRGDGSRRSAYGSRARARLACCRQDGETRFHILLRGRVGGVDGGTEVLDGLAAELERARRHGEVGQLVLQAGDDADGSAIVVLHLKGRGVKPPLTGNRAAGIGGKVLDARVLQLVLTEIDGRQELHGHGGRGSLDEGGGSAERAGEGEGDLIERVVVDLSEEGALKKPSFEYILII